MDMDKYGHAKVVTALVEASEKLKEALGGAQQAHDEPLFHRIFKKQSELMDMAAELIKDKQ